MVQQQLEQCAHCLHSRYHGNPVQLFCIKLREYVLHTASCGEFQMVQVVQPSPASESSATADGSADIESPDRK